MLEDRAFKDAGLQLTNHLQLVPMPPALDGSSRVSGNITTLNGDTISVVVSDAAILFNKVPVVEPDWMFDNGTAHVIGSVILPPDGYLPAR